MDKFFLRSIEMENLRASEKEIVDMYVGGLSMEKISILRNCSKSNIRRILMRVEVREKKRMEYRKQQRELQMSIKRKL